MSAKAAKEQGTARCFTLTEPLQNRGARVRILLPLPNRRSPSQKRRAFLFGGIATEEDSKGSGSE